VLILESEIEKQSQKNQVKKRKEEKEKFEKNHSLPFEIFQESTYG